MASPIWISNNNTPQPRGNEGVTRDGSNARNAIVIDDDEGDIRPSNNLTVPPVVGADKPAVVVLDLTAGSATPPAPHPPEGIAELAGSEVPAEFASERPYTLSWGTHALLPQNYGQSTALITNEEFPDTVSNSAVISSQDKTPRLSQDGSSAGRPSPQRQGSRPRTKDRNGQFKSSGVRRSVGNPKLWDGDDIAAVGQPSVSLAEIETERYCKDGRLVECPGENGVEPHKTTYGVRKVDGVTRFGCFAGDNEFGCGYTASVAEYKIMVIKTTISIQSKRWEGPEPVGEDIAEKVAVVEGGDKPDIAGDGPGVISESLDLQMREDESRNIGTAPIEPLVSLEPLGPLEPLDMEVTLVEEEVQNSSPEGLPPAPEDQGDKPVARVLAVVDEFESVPPPSADEPPATKETSDNSNSQNIVEETRADDISGASEAPVESGNSATIPSHGELHNKAYTLPPATEPEQSIQRPAISSPPPSTPQSPKEIIPEAGNTALETSISKDPAEPEQLDAPQQSNSPPPSPSKTVITILDPEETTTSNAMSSSSTLSEGSVPKQPVRNIARRVSVAPTRSVENTPAPPTTRSSSGKDICVACRRENGVLSADHPVTCQLCKKAWHRSCNAALENMGYKVTIWTCRSCSRSRRPVTRSGFMDSVGKRSSRHSELHGLGPKKREKGEETRRSSFNSPSITLAATATANVGRRFGVGEVVVIDDAEGGARAGTRGKRNRSMSSVREEASPSGMRTRRSGSRYSRNKSPCTPRPEEDGRDDEVVLTPRRSARLERGLEQEVRGKERSAPPAKKRRVSTLTLAVGDTVEEEGDETTIVALESPSKRRRVESPPPVVPSEKVGDEEVVDEEPMVIDEPPQEVEEQVVESVTEPPSIETAEAEDTAIEEQDVEPTEPADESQTTPDQEASVSSKVGKFKPLPTKSLLRLSDMICNSGTSLELPRSAEPETPTLPEPPRAEGEELFPMTEAPQEDPLSLELNAGEMVALPAESAQENDPLPLEPTAGERAPLPTDMPCDIRTFGEQVTCSPALNPEDIDIDAEFEGFRDEGSGNNTTPAENIPQQPDERQKLEEQLKAAKERGDSYARKTKRAKGECAGLKQRIELLEKQIESSSADAVRGLEEQLAAAKARYENAERELEGLKVRVSEFERLQRRCEALQNKLNDSKNSYRQLVTETEGQADKLEAANNEKSSLAQNLESLGNHLDQAHLELQKSRESCKALEQRVATLEKQPPRTPLPSLKDTGVSGSLEQFEELKAHNAVLQGRLDNAATQNAYNQDYTKDVWKLNNKLQKDYNAVSAEITKIKVDNGQLKADNTRIKAGNTRLVVQNTKLKVEYSKLKVENTKLKVENTKLKAEKEELNGTLNSEIANRIFNKGYESTMQRNLGDRENEIDALKRGKAELEETIQKTRDELEELKSSNLTYELLKSHDEEEIKSLKDQVGAKEESIQGQMSALQDSHRQQLEEGASKVKTLEEELERRTELENSLRERLEAAERRCRELEGSVGAPRKSVTLEPPVLPPVEPPFDFDSMFPVTNPMLPTLGGEFDAVGELPAGYQVKTSQSRKERYEAWYNRNPKAPHFHRSCNRELPSIRGKVQVFEADGRECNPEEDKLDLRGRMRKRGEMTFDEFRGVNQNEVIPVSMEKCGKVVFKKIEKNRRTGGLSRNAVIYKTGRNVPGELRG
ncbi:hypothetical protein TWF481_004773 [Arthrobotrys musiformis]|uniref:PHD-type domain-containing protein n=1 Tax=Arthrobotrys musiformis TaxID=47236 RepID=A0AAV9WKI9_9PEZI